MYRIARYITLIVLVTISAATLQGCKNGLFELKNLFSGTIKNVTQWRLFVPNPANLLDVHQLDPNVYFSCELEGSRVYHFEAKLADGVVVAAFDARINQLSGDAQINNVNVDWAWVIGGPFMASAREATGEYRVEISNFHSDVGLETPTTQTFKSAAVMSEALKQYNRVTTTREEK